MRLYGPLFAHLFPGLGDESGPEDHIIQTWTVAKFERYVAAADQLLELKAR